MYVGPWQEFEVMKKLNELKEENRRLTERQLRPFAGSSSTGVQDVDAATTPSVRGASSNHSVQSAPAYTGVAARELLNQSRRTLSQSRRVVPQDVPREGLQRRMGPQRTGSASLEEQQRRRAQLQRLYMEEGASPLAAMDRSHQPQEQRQDPIDAFLRQTVDARPGMVNGILFDEANVLGDSSRTNSRGGGGATLHADRTAKPMLTRNVVQDVLRTGAPRQSRGPIDAVLGGAPTAVPIVSHGGAELHAARLAMQQQRQYDIGAPIRIPSLSSAPVAAPQALQAPATNEYLRSLTALNPPAVPLASEYAAPKAVPRATPPLMSSTGPLSSEAPRYSIPPSAAPLPSLAPPVTSSSSSLALNVAVEVLKLRQQQEIELLMQQHKHKEEQLMLQLTGALPSSSSTGASLPSLPPPQPSWSAGVAPPVVSSSHDANVPLPSSSSPVKSNRATAMQHQQALPTSTSPRPGSQGGGGRGARGLVGHGGAISPAMSLDGGGLGRSNASVDVGDLLAWAQGLPDTYGGWSSDPSPAGALRNSRGGPRR